MKKELQLIINDTVVDTLEWFRFVRDHYTLVSMKQLRHCQAWVYCFATDDGKQYYMLRSYGTMVAGISPDGEKFDWLRYAYFYTATSAQHIAKFFNDYAPNDAYMWRYRSV